MPLGTWHDPYGAVFLKGDSGYAVQLGGERFCTGPRPLWAAVQVPVPAGAARAHAQRRALAQLLSFITWVTAKWARLRWSLRTLRTTRRQAAPAEAWAAPGSRAQVAPTSRAQAAPGSRGTSARRLRAPSRQRATRSMPRRRVDGAPTARRPRAASRPAVRRISGAGHTSAHGYPPRMESRGRGPPTDR